MINQSLNHFGAQNERIVGIYLDCPRIYDLGFGYFLLHCGKRGRGCYRLAVPKSPILPLAAAVTAVTLAASPALATSTSPAKRDDAKVVAFPLVAVKSQITANLESHVSHSSHVSSSGGGHVSHSSHSSHTSSVSHASHTSSVSHSSHASHTSSVNAPAPVTTAPTTTSPSPIFSSSAAPSFSDAGSPSAIPSQSSLTATPSTGGSSSAAAANKPGCGFIIVAPFVAIPRGIKWLASRRRAR